MIYVIMIIILVSLIIFTITFYKSIEKVKYSINSTQKKEVTNITSQTNELIVWNKKIKEKSQLFKSNYNYYVNKKLKVLVGDYNLLMASLTYSVLKEFNFDIFCVPKAEDILSIIRSNRNEYDLIITNNVYNKGMQGKNLYLELKKINCNIPIILLTVDEENRNYYINNLGFNDCIAKPLTDIKICNSLSKLITGLKVEKIKF